VDSEIEDCDWLAKSLGIWKTSEGKDTERILPFFDSSLISASMLERSRSKRSSLLSIVAIGSRQRYFRYNCAIVNAIIHEMTSIHRLTTRSSSYSRSRSTRGASRIDASERCARQVQPLKYKTAECVRHARPNGPRSCCRWLSSPCNARASLPAVKPRSAGLIVCRRAKQRARHQTRDNDSLSESGSASRRDQSARSVSSGTSPTITLEERI